MSIMDLIEQPHRTYKRNVGFWNFLMDSYEGGQDYIGEYIDASHKVYAGGQAVKIAQQTHLFKYKKERTDDFKQRVNMSYYYNFCAPIVDIYTNHLFKNPIAENWGSIENLIEYRTENIDRMDSSIYEFRKEVADLAQIYGHCYVVVDKPNPAMDIRTLQDQIDNSVFPYFTIFHPQQIVNWSLDIYGRPYWVLVREERDGNQDPYNYDSQNLTQVNYRLWTVNEWVLYNGEGQEMRRAAHNMGQVPIVCVVNKKSKKHKSFMGISALADIAYIARDVYNSCSELKQVLREQTFAILTLQGSADEYDEVTVGTSKALLYPDERERPGFISPPGENARVMFEHIEKQISAMFRLAKLEGGSAQFNGQNAVSESGVSKAYDFNETNQALSDKADNLQDAEAKIWRLFAKWEGKEFDGSVVYPDEFSVQNLNDDLDEAEKILKIQLGKAFNLEIKKSIIKKKYPRIADDELDKMITDLETAETKLQTKTDGSRIFGRLGLKATPNANSGGTKEE